MWRLLLLFSLISPTLATAQDMLDADSFDALTQGKTFYYSSGGQPYGAEEYLENRRVRWSFLDGQCVEGHWWQEGDQICFVYDERPDEPQCWTFWMEGGGLAAQFAGESGGRLLYEMEQSSKPMLCLGPKIGV